jgi:hypothetical protein
MSVSWNNSSILNMPFNKVYGITSPNTSLFCFYLALQPFIESEPLQLWGSEITHKDAPQSVRLLWTSDTSLLLRFNLTRVTRGRSVSTQRRKHSISATIELRTFFPYNTHSWRQSCTTCLLSASFTRHWLRYANNNSQSWFATLNMFVRCTHHKHQQVTDNTSTSCFLLRHLSHSSSTGHRPIYIPTSSRHFESTSHFYVSKLIHITFQSGVPFCYLW